MNRLKMVIAASIISAASFADAQTPPADGDASGEQGRHRGPPPEAIAACTGKQTDNTCTFTSRKGDAMTGRCEGPRRPPSSTDSTQPPPPLACRVNRPAPGAPSSN